jgi:hypothetical protein
MWVNPENRTIAEWRTAANVPETRYLIKKARSLMLGGYAAISIHSAQDNGYGRGAHSTAISERVEEQKNHS